MVRRRPAQAVALTVIMVLSVVAMGATAAAPAPDGSAADAVSDAPAAEPSAELTGPTGDGPPADTGDGDVTILGDGSIDESASDAERHVVTLVTGHTLEVVEQGDRMRVSVDSPKQADQVEVYQRQNATYVVPDGVDFDTLSPTLFNVDLLVEQGFTDGKTNSVPVVVTYEDDAASGDLSASAASGVEGFTPERSYDLIDAQAGAISKSESQVATQGLRSQNAVEKVYLDAKFQVSLDESTDAINAPAARSQYNVTGDNSTIAILDTGIDADHPDFGDRVVDRADFSGEGLGDDNGHGTHTAGIAAGDGNVSDGEYVGVAPEAHLMDVKVLGAGGSGALSEIVAGIEYADANGADVISMSLGGPVQENGPMIQAVNAASNNGSLVSASAGNEFFSAGWSTVGSPAAAEGALAVGASDEDEDSTFASARGPAPFTYVLKPDVAAPGVGVTAAGSEDAGEYPYTAKTGTSMSAPHVSGVAALLEQAHPDWSVDTVEDKLVTTADVQDGMDIYKQGGGTVDALDALGSDLLVDNSVQSFGIYSSSTTDTAVVPVHNTGNDSMTVDVSVSAENELDDEDISDQVSVNTSQVTVAPGATEYVELSIDTGDAFGYNAGVVTFDAANETHTSVFGFVRATEVTVEKIPHPDSGGVAGDNLIAFSEDGDLYHSSPIGGGFSAAGNYSFLLFQQDAELTFWSAGQLEAESGQLGGDPTMTVEHGVEVTPGDAHVVLNESATVERDIDLSAFSDQMPLEEREFGASLYANYDGAGFTSYSRSFTGDFGIREAHYSPVDADDLTNVSNTWLLHSDNPDADYALDAENVHYYFEPTLEIPSDGETVTVDEDDVVTDDFQYHRQEAGQMISVAPHVWSPDATSYPVGISVGIVADIGGDRVDQTWYRTPEAAQYSESWYGGEGAFGEWRYDRATDLIAEAGQLNTTFDREPERAALTDWSASDGGVEFTAAAYADQSEKPIVPFSFDNANPNRAAVSVDGQEVANTTFVTAAIDGTFEGLTGSTMSVRVWGNTLENTPRSQRSVTEYSVDFDEDTADAPPRLQMTDIEGLDTLNTFDGGEVTATVTVDEAAGAPLDEFAAYYGVDTGSTPWQDMSGWQTADVEHVSGDTYEVTMENVPGAPQGVDLAFSAVDDDGNSVQTTTWNVGRVTDSGVELVEGQQTHVEPGESVNATFDVSELQQYRASVADASTVSQDDLTLYINGQINAWDAWRAWDSGLTDDDFTVTVEVDEDATGSVVVDHAFRTGPESNTTQSSWTTGPTAVYAPPLTVPGDVDTIQEAVDLAPPGTTIHVDNGTYTEMVSIPKDGITIDAADGVTLTPPNVSATAGHTPVLWIDGDGVTIDGLTIEADGYDAIAAGDSATEATVDNLTVTDTSIENAGVGVSVSDATDPTVEGVTVTNATTGVWVGDSTGTHVADLDAMDVEAGVSLDVSHATVEDTTVEDAHVGVVDRGSHTTADGVTVTDADVGIEAVGPDAAVTAMDLSVSNATTGVNATSGGHVDVTESTIDADTGLLVTDWATVNATLTNVTADTGASFDGADAANVSVHHNDFSGADTVAWADTDQPVDLRLNYVGDRTADDTIAQGSVVYDPFLTEAPDSVDMDTEAIATDVYMDAGETYAVGVPGPTDQTVGDVFGNFTGAAYGWNVDSQSWEMVTGDDDLSALDALAVVAQEDVRATMTFQTEGISTPGQTTLSEGWNYVAAPAYADVDDAFQHSTADLGLALSMFESPDSQLGPESTLEGTYAFGSGDAPTASALEGVFVYAEESGTLPAYLFADPTMVQLYETLGLSPALGSDSVMLASLPEPADTDDEDGDESATRATPPLAA